MRSRSVASTKRCNGVLKLTEPRPKPMELGTVPKGISLISDSVTVFVQFVQFCTFILRNLIGICLGLGLRQCKHTRNTRQERKRHTDRGVSSIPSVVLYRGGGGTPAGGEPPAGGGTPSLPGGPQPDLMGGTRGGVPPSRDGVPQADLMGVPEVGYPPTQGTPWQGLPPK